MYAARADEAIPTRRRRITRDERAEVVELAGLRARETLRTIARSTCRGCRRYGVSLDDAGMCDPCVVDGRTTDPAGFRPYPPAKSAAL